MGWWAYSAKTRFTRSKTCITLKIFNKTFPNVDIVETNYSKTCRNFFKPKPHKINFTNVFVAQGQKNKLNVQNRALSRVLGLQVDKTFVEKLKKKKFFTGYS